jgi:GGDEF domain-containing protein
MIVDRGNDPYSGAHIVDSRMFRLLVDLEVQKARRLHYCIAVVCLTADVLGGATTEETGSPVASLVSRQLRATDVVAPYGPSFVAMLLVDAEPGDLPSITDRLIDHLGAVPWSAGGSCYPHHVTMADDLLRQAVNLMVHARDAGGCRLVAHG